MASGRHLMTVAGFLLLLVAGNAAHAEDDLHVTSNISDSVVQIGQPVIFSIRATAPKGWEVLAPERQTELGDLRVVQSSDVAEQSAEQMTWLRRLVIESYAPGLKTVAPVAIRFRPASRSDEAAVRTLKTEPTALRVQSAIRLFESRDLRPIDDAVSVPWTWRQWSWAAAALAGLFLVGRLVVRWINRLPKEGRLSGSLLWRQCQRVREQWLRGELSDAQAVDAAAQIARRWLQWRAQKLDTHRTTAGWQSHLEQARDGSCWAAIEVLRLADRVKFAESEATLDDVRSSLAQLENTVRPQRAQP